MGKENNSDFDPTAVFDAAAKRSEAGAAESADQADEETTVEKIVLEKSAGTNTEAV